MCKLFSYVAILYSYNHNVLCNMHVCRYAASYKKASIIYEYCGKEPLDQEKLQFKRKNKHMLKYMTKLDTVKTISFCFVQYFYTHIKFL